MKNNTIKSAYFAAGCFWGVEYYFEKLEGVKTAISGYMGGHLKDPTYHDICTGTTGHLEVVQVNYDSEKISFEELVKFFFEIHNFTQRNGQGPDIGPQYLSAIFYDSAHDKEIASGIIDFLQSQNYDVATTLIDATYFPFYEAESYHQDYYVVNNKIPYCHSYTKIF